MNRRRPTQLIADEYRQRLAVPFEYSVHFTRGLLRPDNPLLAQALRKADPEGPHRVLVYVDDGVAQACPGVIPELTNSLRRHPDLFDLVRAPETIPGGERAKNGWNVVQNIMATAGFCHLCRHSLVIAVGGGSVLDLVGFAASLVHRGVRLVRVPTTVLAQCDGGVGVKTGMDEHGMKNFVGTFAPPFAVFNDFDFLRTLDDKYWFGGVAEAFKVAIIKDRAFFDWLDESAARIRARDDEAIEEAVRRTAVLHLEHIRTGGDPFEFGSARPLDFGHWAAHKLEVMSHYTIGHGQGVALGIALDSCYAARQGLLAEGELQRILDVFRRTSLPIWNPLLESRTPDGELLILKGLEEFREHLGGRLSVTLPQGLGAKVEVHEIDLKTMRDGIRYLRKAAEA